MLRFIQTLILLAWMTCPAHALVIWNNPGGNPDDFEKRANDANFKGETIEIRGRCDSACTVYLGARYVCIAPNAQIGFHEVRVVKGDQTYRQGVRTEEGTRDLVKWYPYSIYRWVKRHDAVGSGNVTYMSGRTAIRLGMPQCPDRTL